MVSPKTAFHAVVISAWPMLYAEIVACGATPFSTTDARAVCVPTAPGAIATVDEIDAAATIRKMFWSDTGMSYAYMKVAFTPMRATYDAASTPTTCTRNLRGMERITPPSFVFCPVSCRRRLRHPDDEPDQRSAHDHDDQPPGPSGLRTIRSCTSNEPATLRKSQR